VLKFKRKFRRQRVNHCCRGKAMCYIFWEFDCRLMYPACNAHTPYYIVFSGLSGCTIFFNIISWMARYSKIKLSIIKCVFGLSLQSLSATFLILRRIQRDIIINVRRPVR